MSSDVAIRVEGLGKMYRIGGPQARYNTFRETLTDAFVAPFRRAGRLLSGQGSAAELDQTIWALKNINFEVKRGEVVGIIGRNGAGKSTLLKILSRITEPTEGKADIFGRVGSLLEVGTGFHPELTGRENIYLNGAILGMHRTEIAGKLDEIVAFAEIEKFLDTPVKHYSSGMYVRLAFAVAAHLEPEILLVDEVLSVGDAAFQQKCIGKLQHVAGEGRTVLFVSHNMGAIARLCESVFVMTDGEIEGFDDVRAGISRYLHRADAGDHETILESINFKDPAIEVDSIEVNNSTGHSVRLNVDENQIEFTVKGSLVEPSRVDLEVRITDLDGVPLAYFSPGHNTGKTTRNLSGSFRIDRKTELPRVTRGEYFLSIYLTDPGKKYWIKAPNAARLIVEGNSTTTGRVFEYSKGNGWVILV